MADEPKMPVMPAHFAAKICLDPADFIEEGHSDEALGMSTPELNTQCQQIVDELVGAQPKAPREDENKTLARITKFFLTAEEQVADAVDEAPKEEEPLAKEEKKPVKQEKKPEKKTDKKAKPEEDVPAQVASEPTRADQSPVVASLGVVVPPSAGALFVYGVSGSDFKTSSDERRVPTLSSKSADVLENIGVENFSRIDQGAAILFQVPESASFSTEKTDPKYLDDSYFAFLSSLISSPRQDISVSPSNETSSVAKERDPKMGSASAGLTQSFLEMAYRVGILGEKVSPLDSGRKKKSEESAPLFFLHSNASPLDPQVIFVGYPIVLPRMQGASSALMMVSEGKNYISVERKGEGQPSKDSKQGNGQDSGRENQQGRGSKQNNPSYS